MRILIRTSRWAIWARRFGSFSVPLLVLPIVMHREQLLPSDSFLIVISVAILIGLIAALCALIAYARLWQTGDRGWGRASAGLVLGLVCLAPFAYGAWMVPKYPLVSDVTTSVPGTPALVTSRISAQNKLAAPETATYFPNAVPRNYLAAPEDIFAQVKTLIQARGWSIRQERLPTSNMPGHISAIAMTLLGWRDEVVVQVRQDIDGTVVSMRSASLADVEQDLGKNGTRIEQFLTDLDSAVSDATRNNLGSSSASADPLSAGQ